jgi:hypothetical protein
MVIYHLLMIFGVKDTDNCHWIADVVARETDSNRPIVILFTSEHITCSSSELVSLLWGVFCLWEEFHSSIVAWGRKCRVFNFVERKCRRMNSEVIVLCMSYECVSPEDMGGWIYQFFCVSTPIMVLICLLVECNSSGIPVMLERERVTKDWLLPIL